MCTLYESETNVYKHVMFLKKHLTPCRVCRVLLGKITYKTDIMDERIYFSYFNPQLLYISHVI